MDFEEWTVIRSRKKLFQRNRENYESTEREDEYAGIKDGSESCSGED